jgi:acyl-CoA thioesterase-2
MATALDDLVCLLDLEPLEVNLFRGLSPQGRERIFGGHVLAQALVAAGRTVDPDRPVHSMHAYFLRPGDPRLPVVFDVDRIRDGRSFTTRRVIAVQHGEAIFNAAAQFHVAEAGPEHQDAMPDVPDPDGLPDFVPEPAPGGSPWVGDSPIVIRFPGPAPWSRERTSEPDQSMWVRVDGMLPDDRLLHAALGAYASDLALLPTTAMPHASPRSPDLMLASIDHVMWFHRPFRADDWLLYHNHSPSASGARGFAHGSVFRRDGTLVMSVAQEGLVRPVRAVAAP